MDVSVALGGGGVRGLAHLGVLQAFNQLSIHVKALAGTSAGAIAGSLFAAGYSPDEVLEMFNRMSQNHMFGRTSQDAPSLLGFSGVNAILQEALGGRTFESLDIPFACTAVDLNTSQEVIFTKGPLLEPVLASAAVPGVFPAQVIGGHHLVDGGVMDPVPVRVARLLRPDLPVIAVALSPSPVDWKDLPTIEIPNSASLPMPRVIVDRLAKLRMAQALHTFVQSTEISSRLLTELRLNLDRPDVIIRPCIWTYGWLDTVNPRTLFKIGEDAAQESLPEIQKSMAWTRRLARKFLPAEDMAPFTHFEG